VDPHAFRAAMEVLERRHPIADWTVGMTSFEVLVSTILSQSTTVRNERLGMDGLRATFGAITAEALATAAPRRIERSIRRAGLARSKSRRIRDVARTVVREMGGDLDRLLRRDPEESRDALTTLPGVGPKTADVVLAMAAGRPVFPVDTHVARIARRWALVRRAGYEETRRALERRTPPDRRRTWHLVLIAHGRETCTARNPRCEGCPVSSDCDWYRARVRRHRDKHLR